VRYFTRQSRPNPYLNCVIIEYEPIIKRTQQVPAFIAEYEAEEQDRKRRQQERAEKARRKQELKRMNTPNT